MALVLLAVSCSKKDWSSKDSVPLTLTSDFSDDAELGNNRLTVDSSELYISTIKIEGTRLQAEDVSFTLNYNKNVSLIGLEKLLVADLPIGTYENIKVTLDYSGEGYVNGEINKINGNPDQKDLIMPMVFSETKKTYHLIDSDEGKLISIGEKNHSLELSFHLKQTLNGVGNGAWNGLITASQAQNQVDLLTVAGQNFLINFKEQLIEKSQLILK